MMTNRGQA
jgi:ribosomal protein L7/L12